MAIILKAENGIKFAKSAFTSSWCLPVQKEKRNQWEKVL